MAERPVNESQCPQCGMGVYATYYERQYGVAPGVAIHNGWPLGHQWAICLQGHRWVPALLAEVSDD